MLLSFSVLVLVLAFVFAFGRVLETVGVGRRGRRRKVGMIVESRVYAGMGSSLVREVVCSMLFCGGECVSENEGKGRWVERRRGRERR